MVGLLPWTNYPKRWSQEQCYERLLEHLPQPPMMELAQFDPRAYEVELRRWLKRVRRENQKLIIRGRQPAGLEQFLGKYPTYPFVDADFMVDPGDPEPASPAAQTLDPEAKDDDPREVYLVLRGPRDPDLSRRLRLWALRSARHNNDAQLRALTEELRRVNAQIRQGQQHRTDLLAEEHRAAELIGETAEPSAEAGEEFDRIMRLPGVVEARPVPEGIEFIVEARHRRHGVLYDLGDWAVALGPRMYEFRGVCVRSGLRRSWPNGEHPAYRLLDLDHFCFGPRQYELDRHLAKGQYLEAMALAVECFNSINPEDRHLVDRAFRRVKAGA